MMIFRILGFVSFIFVSRFTPVVSGSLMSIRAMLNSLASAFSVASLPVAADSTLYPSPVKISLTTFLMLSSSSTMRMLGFGVFKFSSAFFFS